jgi:hypothetical protein
MVEPKILDQIRNGIRRAISEWLVEPIGAKTRLIHYLERALELALEKGQPGAVFAGITAALRFGPGEVTRQEIEHSGKVVNEERVLILPQTLSQDEWQKKHNPPPDETTH